MSLRSMTGFGRAEGKINTHHFTVEVKSVNHRFLDSRFRLPHALALFENVFTERLKASFERGAFEVNVRYRLDPTAAQVSTGTRFVVDDGALKSLVSAVHAAQKLVPSLSNAVTLEALLAAERVILPIEEPESPESLLKGVLPILDAALEELRKMRDAEGKKIQAVLAAEIGQLTRVVESLSSLAVEQPKKIHEKLKQRISQWSLAHVDAQRLEMEIALYAERADITEELDRLRAHLKAFSDHLTGGKSVGRKLDFLTQELHREINTVGSKASLLEVTQASVEAKTSIEKLREQVQNVE